MLTSELEREDRISVLVPVLSVRNWRGDPVDELLAELEHLAADTTDPSIVTGARADRAFARGQFDAAAAGYRRAAVLSAGNAFFFYAFAARASLLARDAASAASYSAVLEATGAHGMTIDARRASIRAGLAALDGRPADALSLYRDALRRFRDLGLSVDEAFTAIEMATLLDPAEPEVRVATGSAREIFLASGPAIPRAARRGAVALT